MVCLKVFLIVALMSLINYAYCKPSDDNNNHHGFLNFLIGTASKELTDACLSEVGMTMQEFRDQKQDQPPTEKCLCFIKCMATNSGKLAEDGTLNISAIKSDFPDKLKDQLDTSIACMEKLDTITTCAAVKDVLKCIPKPLKKDN